MGLITRVLDNLEERRQKILSGGINCIPSPFASFRKDFPGIEQGKYYLISGGTKAGKTQITSYLFLYTPILYAYYHPEQVRIKIFYFPLEETPEKITMRFMCYLLYTLSNKKIRISPMELGSIDKDNLVSPEILETLHSSEYQSILKFFEEHVIFLSDRNPTGCWKVVNKYAEGAGIVHRKKVYIENKETGLMQEKEVFDFYEPKDPDEYVEIIWDHAGNTDNERGMNDREKIKKLSEYFMILRNHYNYIPVLLQQQNTDTLDLDAYKASKIRPTFAGLADGKDSGRDCSVMLGITNPFAFEMPTYLGYEITRLKDNARFLEVVLNREGVSNGVLALYFDGAVNYFAPLPKSTDIPNMKKVYDLIERNRSTRT